MTKGKALSLTLSSSYLEARNAIFQVVKKVAGIFIVLAMKARKRHHGCGLLAPVHSLKQDKYIHVKQVLVVYCRQYEWGNQGIDSY